MSTRRTFVKQSLIGASAFLLPVELLKSEKYKGVEISLAQWSVHRAIEEGRLDHLDFPAKAKNEFGINVVEYVNTFFGSKKTNFKEAGKSAIYLKQLLQRSKNAGVKNHLIMVDDEGFLALPKDKERLEAVDNHKKWIEAAKFLECKTVRVNLHGEGSAADKKIASIDSLSKLGLFAKSVGINIVVENHGHESSDAGWVASIIKQVNMSNVGTLPDFGNFCMTQDWGSSEEGCEKEYDRYKGIQELMPFAKGVSAKTYDFDSNGEQTMIDYKRMLGIVKAAKFEGYIGIEFEGHKDEDDGIRQTKKLIEKYL